MNLRLYGEVINENKKNILIGTFYRHPSRNDKSFLEYLERILTKIKSDNKTAVITEDFNYNLLKYNNDENTEEFLNLFLENLFQLLIFYPTRIVEKAKPSLIDDIFINNLKSDTISGNIVNKISDHMPNFAIIKNSKKKIDISLSRMKRDYSNYDKENFLRQLSKEDLKDSINACSDVNNKFEIFHEHFMKTFEKHVPLKRISKTKRNNNKSPGSQQPLGNQFQLKKKTLRNSLKQIIIHFMIIINYTEIK